MLLLGFIIGLFIIGAGIVFVLQNKQAANKGVSDMDKKVLVKTKDDYKDLVMCIDGDNKSFNNVDSIETFISSKSIKCLRMHEFHFIKAINDKILNNEER